MRTLVAIPFSPWSEKARWALDHHGIAYHEASYTPVVGEYALRWQMRRPFGRITVPVLRDGDRWLTDSYDIARHADRIGRGSPLFPAGSIAEITAWNERSEIALAAGRAILMQRFARSPELAAAALPFRLPGTLAPIGQRLGRLRLARFMAKYGIRPDDDGPREVLAAELEGLERVLADGRFHLVGGRFSHADIAMALTLQQVRPVDPRWIVRMEGLGPAGMNLPELEERHAALFAWRDALYAGHRRPERGQLASPTSPSAR